MDYLPLFAELKQRPVLVIGGGEIAERKIKFLLRAQAQVQVVAGTLSPALADLAARQALSWRATEFSDALVDDVFLVIAATEDEALNQRVFAAANARYRLVNVVDNQALCSFVFPSCLLYTSAPVTSSRINSSGPGWLISSSSTAFWSGVGCWIKGNNVSIPVNGATAAAGGKTFTACSACAFACRQ